MSVFDSADNSAFASLAAMGMPKPEVEKPAGPLTGAVLDSAKDDMADQLFRREAMASALTWVEDDDYSFSALSDLAVGMVVDSLDDITETIIDDGEADEGDDEGEVLDSADDGPEFIELDEDDADVYNYALGLIADSLVDLGADADHVIEFINDESDDAGERLGSRMLGVLDSSDLSDDDLIDGHAVGGQIMDAMVRKMVDGKLTWKKKPTRKRKMSSKQKAALKKARKKSNTGAAKKARAKSMKVRKQRGV